MAKKRTLIVKGCYRDKHGVAIVVSVGGTPREFRKNEQGRKYSTFTPSDLVRERKRIDAREHLKAERVTAKEGTLAADVLAYLKTLSGRTKDDAENLLAHWLTAFRERDRTEITALELRQHAATWTCAASTFNHRRQALISVCKALDGPSAAIPAREIPKRKETMGAPKAISYTVIDAALQAMPATKSRARLKLMAYTGLPQMQIQKLTPNDWQGDQLRVTPRRKGAGVAGVLLPLSPEAQGAMVEFTLLKAWGNFSRSSLHKAWQAVGPPGTAPYSLRHSWITELYRRSNGDVLAVKQLALHSMLAQTERYAAAALTDRMQALVLPRISTTTPPAKRPKASTIVRRRPTTMAAKSRRKTGTNARSTEGK